MALVKSIKHIQKKTRTKSKDRERAWFSHFLGYRPLLRQPLFRQNASEKAQLTLTLILTVTITITNTNPDPITVTHCITDLVMSE